MAIEIFALSVTIYEICADEIFMALTFRRDQGLDVYMPIKSQNKTFYLMVIGMFALSVTIYKIFSPNLLDL